MIEPEVFDVVELLIDLPEYNLRSGVRGAIVACYSDEKHEVELSNEEGETIGLCTVLPEQFVVVWKSQTKSWLSVSEQLAEVVNHLSEERQQEVLEFARSLYQR